MKYTITEAVAGQTVTEFLRQTIGVSARDCQKLLRNKKVTVNGKAAHSKRILNVGDTVMVRRPAEHATLTTTANEPIEPTIATSSACPIDKWRNATSVAPNGNPRMLMLAANHTQNNCNG